MIDEARLIGGAKAVVDVDRRNAARARAEHSQQSREPLEAAPYPTLVGTAITGQLTKPPITLANVPSMPAMAMTTRADESSCA